MGLSNQNKSEVFDTKFIRISKYLLPKTLNLFRLWHSSAPSEICSLTELANKHPQRVSLKVIPATDVGAIAETYEVIEGTNIVKRRCSAFPNPATTVATISGGSTIGRQCCILGPGNELVHETAYYIDDSELRNRFFLRNLDPRYWRHRYEGDLRMRPGTPKRVHLSGRVAAINNRAAHNFYHWLLEVIPRVTALRLTNTAVDRFVVDCQSEKQIAWLERLGIRRDQLIQPHCCLNLQCDQLVHVTFPGVACLSSLSAQIRGSMPDVEPHRRIYISRRKAGNRRVLNENELQVLLKKYEFETYFFEELSLSEQARIVTESRIILTAHGSALANLVWARSGTDVIELFPKGRRNIDLFPSLSVLSGAAHHTVICKTSGRKQNILAAISGIEQVLNDCTRKSETRSRQKAVAETDLR